MNIYPHIWNISDDETVASFFILSEYNRISVNFLKMLDKCCEKGKAEESLAKEI